MRVIFLILSMALAGSLCAQDETGKKIAIKWAPAALLAGAANLQAEYMIDEKHSLTANIGIPLRSRRTLTYQNSDAQFDMRATGFLAGYRFYLSDRYMSGIYLEPYFRYLHHTAEGTGYGTLDGRAATFNISNEYNSMGIGAQLGAQFIFWDKMVLDLFLIGPEGNMVTDNLKAVEVAGNRPWTSREALQAEIEIKNFINQIPFLRNKTTVMVDKDTRSIIARFNGPMPGFRAGISIGIRF